VSTVLLLAAGFSALAFGTEGKEAALQTGSTVKHEQIPGFSIIGVAVRTNNANEMNHSGKIGALWQRFMQDQMAAKIPGRIDNHLVTVLTDYQSDQSGDYTYILGAKVEAKVASTDHVPEGMVAKQVPAGTYAVFQSETGVPADVVPRLWQRIWATSPQEMGGKRSFRTDFELYGSGGDPQHVQVQVYIGLQ
jgi:predicted transcriptional regulator YdeE